MRRPTGAGLFGSAFEAALPLAVILAFGQLANAACGPVAQVSLMTGLEKICSAILVLANAVLVVGYLVLVPEHGVLAAAFVTAAAVTLWNVLLARSIRARLGIATTASPRSILIAAALLTAGAAAGSLAHGHPALEVACALAALIVALPIAAFAVLREDDRVALLRLVRRTS